MLVATLIAAPASSLPADRLIDRLAGAIAAAGGKIGDLDWLDSDRAVDFHFAHPDLATARQAIANELESYATDHYVQESAGRKKRLLLCDMDSTIVAGETLDDLSPFAGLRRAEINALTQKSVAGEMSFADSLRARTRLLAGLTEEHFAAAYARQSLNPGAAELIAACRRLGIRTALVSGGFAYFVDRIAQRLGFDLAIANRPEMAASCLTGELLPPLIGPDGEFGKSGQLRRLAAEAGLDLAATAAIGDGANDIPMLQAAGLGCAWRAKARVRAVIPCRLDHGDLTGLLHFMGYRRDEIAD